MSSFYTCVPKIKIVWCVHLEICSVRDIILSFWGIFCTLTPLTIKKIKTFCPFFAFLPPPPSPHPLTAWKIKILKKQKSLEISSFYTSCAPKIMITWCTVSEIWCVTDELRDRQTNGWKSDIQRWEPQLKIWISKTVLGQCYTNIEIGF